MLTFAIAVGSFFAYLIAYHTYGRWLARKLFKLDDAAPVPAHELRDDRDFCPARRSVLFGHHFTSIAGTGPIVGPALAVIWGWLPALLWVLLGSIFIGAVHDLGALVISVRNRGQTIGEVAGRLISPRVKILFLLILFMALTIVLAIFGLVIASIFAMYPASVLTIWLEIPLAIAMGYWLYRKGKSPTIPAIVALAIMLGAIVLAVYVPALQLTLDPVVVAGFTVSPIVLWSLLLFVYCYIASTLPVWTLLQPRDYINANKLILCLLLLVGGIGFATFTTEGGVPMVAPVIQIAPAGAPPIMPFLFVTIACGAISGFHCLVGSGTTSKQLNCETDAQFIGYGSMLTEGFLAVLVILACCAGLGLGENRAPVTYLATLNNDSDSREERITDYGEFVLEDDRRIVLQDRLAINKSTGEIIEQPKLFALAATDRSSLSTVPLLEVFPLRGGHARLLDSGELRVTGQPAWLARYSSWSAAGGLAAKVGAFVDGAGNFVAATGIPRPVGVAIMAVLVASFAATTLDTATRLQRYVIQGLAADLSGRSGGGALATLVAPLTTKYGATAFAVAAAAIIAVMPPPGEDWQTGMGKGGLILWPLFGAVNQLLAGLAFMVVAIYLVRRGLPRWFIIGPMTLMLIVPFAAMIHQIFAGWGPLAFLESEGWLAKGQWHLVITGLAICALEIWMVAEAVKLWPTVRGVLEPALPPIRRGFPIDAVPAADGGRSC